MKLFSFNDEKRCYECGKMLLGKGVFIGDENWEVPTRALCFGCIDKLFNLKKGK